MKNIIIFHDTLSHTFIVDRLHPQVIKDFVKPMVETNVSYAGLDPKTTATYFRSRVDRISIVRISGKGGHLAKSVDTIIKSLVESENVELELTDPTLTFYEFIRISHDLPKAMSVITNDDGNATLTTSDGMVVDGQKSYMFRYHGCELHFEVGKMTIISQERSSTGHRVEPEIHDINTQVIDVVNVIIPICIGYMNRIIW